MPQDSTQTTVMQRSLRSPNRLVVEFRAALPLVQRRSAKRRGNQPDLLSRMSLKQRLRERPAQPRAHDLRLVIVEGIDGWFPREILRQQPNTGNRFAFLRSDDSASGHVRLP